MALVFNQDIYHDLYFDVDTLDLSAYSCRPFDGVFVEISDSAFVWSPYSVRVHEILGDLKDRMGAEGASDFWARSILEISGQ